jgi:hypothetical protein
MALTPGNYGGVNLSQEQLNNVEIINNVGRSMGASDRDVEIAIMTAMQESNLKNVRYGDRDSLGLFQQRPSQGWGTQEQVLNPEYSSRKFYEHLLAIPNRDQLSLTQAAQKVQRSAFPNAYAKWERMAAALIPNLMGQWQSSTIPAKSLDILDILKLITDYKTYYRIALFFLGILLLGLGLYLISRK